MLQLPPVLGSSLSAERGAVQSVPSPVEPPAFLWTTPGTSCHRYGSQEANAEMELRGQAFVWDQHLMGQKKKAAAMQA